MSEPRPDPVFFDAVLRPAPPLSAHAMVLVLSAVGLANFAFGMIFVLKGAWPVMPFMGVDVALLAWAFHVSRRAARAHEHVILTLGALRIARYPRRGPPSEICLNPYWLQVRLEEDVEPGRHLLLSSHGRSVELGSFLAPEERIRLAEALKTALVRAKSYRG